MFDHKLEPKPSVARWVEVFTGTGRRRRWSSDEKARILEETLAVGAVVSEVARRHGITSQQLFGWRRSARGRAIERSDAPGFAAVMLEAPAEKAALDGAVLEILVGAMVARVPLTAFALRPVYESLFDVLKGSDKLFADETRAPVLDPGRRKTKTGQLWAYARDDRPWGGPEPPGVAYVYEPDRKHERPAAHLAGFAGCLQVDGYGAYKALAEGNAVTLAFCWAHARRNFFDIQAANPAPIAVEALARIGGLYAIERDIRGLGASARLAARQARARHPSELEVLVDAVGEIALPHLAQVLGEIVGD